LEAATTLELKNLLVDARFYLLDGLVATLSAYLAVPDVLPAEKLAWPPVDQNQWTIEHFASTQDPDTSHLHTFRIKNVRIM
jgi:hypothetical protein